LILKNHADLAAKLGSPRGCDAGGILMADETLATGGCLDQARISFLIPLLFPPTERFSWFGCIRQKCKHLKKKKLGKN